MTINNIIKNEKGFTLVELIVAPLTICAIAGTIYLGVQASRALHKYINQPIIQRANVLGDEGAELFIEKDGKRFYAEIDGKPVSEYLKK